MVLAALRRQEKATFTHYCKQVVSTPKIGTLVHKDLLLVTAKPFGGSYNEKLLV